MVRVRVKWKINSGESTDKYLVFFIKKMVLRTTTLDCRHIVQQKVEMGT